MGSGGHCNYSGCQGENGRSTNGVSDWKTFCCSLQRLTPATGWEYRLGTSFRERLLLQRSADVYSDFVRFPRSRECTAIAKAKMTSDLGLYDVDAHVTPIPELEDEDMLYVSGDLFTDTNGSMSPPTQRPIPSNKCFSDDLWTVRTVTTVYISLPLALMGILGNIVTFIVLCRSTQRPKLTTTVLLQALALADISVLLLAVLLYSLRYVHGCWGILSWYVRHLPKVFCSMYPTLYILRMTNIWLTVLLTIDRYIAVRHPLQALRFCTIKRAYKNMAAVLASSILFSLPRFFEYSLSRGQCKPTTLNESTLYTITYKLVIFSIVMYVVPVSLLICLNSLLLCTLHRADTYRAVLRQSQRFGTSTGKSSGGARNQPARATNRSVTIIVIVIVTVCIISDGTAMTSHILFALRHIDRLSVYRRYVSNFANVAVTFNAAINFIIYCLCSKNFRAGLRSTFSCGRSGCSGKQACCIKKTTPGLTMTNLSYLSLSRSASRVQQQGE